MGLHAPIAVFLKKVRQHLHRRERLVWSLYGLGGVVALAVVLPGLALLPGAFGMLPIAICTTALLVGVTIYLAGFRPRKQWHADTNVVRYVGERIHFLSSDLLSSVELAANPELPAGISSSLVEALQVNVASRVNQLKPAQIVGRQGVRGAVGFSMSVFGVGLMVVALAPDFLATGWHKIVHPTTEVVPTAVEPIVTDIRFAIDYPAYTNRSSEELPTGTGDLEVLPGTTVHLKAKSLKPISAAQLHYRDELGELLSPTGLLVQGHEMSGQFVVHKNVDYQFELTLATGETHKDPHFHTIQIIPDKNPTVVLFAPSDELDVTNLGQIELAYSAADDYLVEKLELVWADSRTPDAVQRTDLPITAASQLEGKYIWDLAQVALEPGARVAYYFEVTDNDTVSGPNKGQSNTFFLRVFSPRERHEALVERQRRLFEDLIRQLGGRLTLTAANSKHRSTLHQQAKLLIVELAKLVSDMRSDELVAQKLLGELDKIRRRIDRLVTKSAKLQRTMRRSSVAATRSSFAANDKKWITELEDDVLSLADWLDRQQMETLLAISDDIQDRQERIRDLLKEWGETGSEQIKEQLEREIRALEAKIAEMQQQQRTLASDVIDQFVNRDALKNHQEKSCLAEVKALIAAGDVEGANAKLEECNNALDATASALEDALQNLRGEKFSDEEKALGEAMNELADVTHAQEKLANATDDIWQRMSERAKQHSPDAEKLQQAQSTMQALQKHLDAVPQASLTPQAQRQLEQTASSLQQAKENLAAGDVAQALADARNAEANIQESAEELRQEAQADESTPWQTSTKQAYEAARNAVPLSGKLVEQLAELLPPSDQLMNKQDRTALEKLSRRQEQLRRRAESLQQKSQRSGNHLPPKSAQAMGEGIQRAIQHMDRAQQQLAKGDPVGGRQEARDAATQLKQTQKDAQQQARSGQQRSADGKRELVRIPRAEEHKTSKEFREELLEAMKKSQSPAGFRELVKRYYQELIR